MSEQENVNSNIVARSRQVLKRYPFIRLGILFGSLAKGCAKPESDLDIAVAAEQPLDVHDKIELISDFAEEFGRPADLVDLPIAGEPLLGQILTNGKIIIGDDSCYARLLTRHLFNQSDFMPYRNRILKERRWAWIVVEQKLESLRRSLNRVKEKHPTDVSVLMKDYDIQDVIVLNLTRAIQICVDIGASLISETEFPPPDTMGQVFDILHEAGIIQLELANNMKKAVGFRNLSIHNYKAIDWAIVDVIVKKHLSDFEDFAKTVVMFHNKQK